MPHFHENPLDALALKAGEADAEIDLRGMTQAEALARAEELIHHADAAGPRSFLLRFDPPRGDGSETLFQPLGRHLLEARRAGLLASCLPMPDGSAYFIVLADRP